MKAWRLFAPWRSCLSTSLVSPWVSFLRLENHVPWLVVQLHHTAWYRSSSAWLLGRSWNADEPLFCRHFSLFQDVSLPTIHAPFSPAPRERHLRSSAAANVLFGIFAHAVHYSAHTGFRWERQTYCRAFLPQLYGSENHPYNCLLHDRAHQECRTW